MTTLSRRWIDRAGIRLSYQDTGPSEGVPLVLLAGFGQSGSSWIPWLDQVGPLPGRVVLPDHRGTGESSRSLRPYTLGVLADDVAAVVGDTPAIVVGESMGGMVAQHLVLRHPHRVAGLVLAASSARGTAMSSGFLRSLPLTVAAALSTDVRVWARCDRLLVQGDTRVLAPLRAIQRRESYSPANSVLQALAMAGHRTAGRLGAVDVPVEVLAGAGDRMLSPHHSRVLAKALPHARLTILPDTGHLIALERPASLRRAIERLAGGRLPSSGGS